jgi:hypothetical protein
MAGVPFNKDALNNSLGSVVQQIYASLDNARKVQTALAATPNQTMLDMGFTQADIDSIKSAFVDLDNLRQVFEGGRNQTVAYDFRTFAKRLIGIGLY